MSDAAIFVWILFIAHVAISILYCFFGYKHFRVLISAYAFLAIFPITFAWLSDMGSLSDTAVILISAGIACLVTALTWAIYKISLFICGGMLGAGIASMIFQAGLPDVAAIVLTIALFIVFGILTMKFRKVLIILSSSLIGGFSLFVYGYYILFNFAKIATLEFAEAAKLSMTFTDIIGSNYWLYIIPIVISILGIVAQAKGKGPKRSSKRDLR